MSQHRAARERSLDEVTRTRLESVLRSDDSSGWVPTGPGAGDDVAPARVEQARGMGHGQVGHLRGDDVHDDLEDGAANDSDAGPTRRASVGVTLSDRLPVGLRACLVAVPARALAALTAVLGLGLVLALGAVWLARPTVHAVPRLHRTVPAGAVGAALPSGASAAPGPSVSAAPSPSPSMLVVDVTGAVQRPGVVELPAGARVADAIDAAGGPGRRAELASVNLARLVVDGEQIVVARRGRPLALPAPGSPSSTAGAPATPIDLNTATGDQLESLPGVGPVLAQRILDWRTAHGGFGSVDELTEVSGIGEATLADLRTLVRV